MINLSATRADTETVKNHFFPIINMYKLTRLKNVQHMPAHSEEYLAALTLNCLLLEVEHLIEKKLVNTIGQKIKFQFTDAQGIILYRSLLALPLPSEEVYFNMTRNVWIEFIDQQLHQSKVLLI